MTTSDTAPSQPNYRDLEAENQDLKRRLSDLERRIAELDSRPARLWALNPAEVRRQIKPILLLTGTLLLAVVPPLLVVQDKWLGNKAVSQLFAEQWKEIRQLTQLAFPPYFALVFLCVLGLVALLATQKMGLPIASNPNPTGASSERDCSRVSARQSRVGRALLLGSGAGFLLVFLGGILQHRRPGWDLVLVVLAYLLGWILRESPVGLWFTAWQRNRGWLLAFAVALSALMLSAASRFGAGQSLWVQPILLSLVGVGLLRYRGRTSPTPWLVMLAMVLYTINIDAWWLSGIGDEYAFYFQALEMVEKHDLSVIGAQLFNGQVVYAAHPYISSLIQATSMKILGANGFGWRFSNVFLSASAIGLFFLFFRTFVSCRTAVAAALFLAVSHYLMSFSKIGYNNLQALFVMSLSLWAAAWALKTRRVTSFATLGIALGLCFYVYPGALYVVPIPLLLLLIYYPPTCRPAMRRWSAMALSLLMLVFPLFLQPNYWWESKQQGTLFNAPQYTDSLEKMASYVARQLVYAGFSFINIPHESHFVAVSYVDPLTAVFVSIGIACLLRSVRRDRFAVFFMASFALLLFLVGSSHGRDFPSVTRMFLLLPWFALFAAMGLTWLLDQIKRLGLFPVPISGLMGVVLAAVLGLNLYQAYPLARDRMAGYQSLDTLFLRLVQRAQPAEATAPKTYVFVFNQPNSTAGLRWIPRINPVQARITELVISSPTIPDTSRTTLADRNTLIIVRPELGESWQKALEPQLRALGKSSCGIKTTTGGVRFNLWHSPESGWLCE